jgi:hypothetical protein
VRQLGDTPLDAVARGLASGMSRRDALRAGGAALVGAVAITPADAWATVTGRCPSHRVKCHDTCCPKGEVCLPPKHKGGKRHCGCTAHKTRCGSTCVNLASDPHHCGHCSHNCPSGNTCVHGTCTAPTEPSGCASGEVMCAGTCVTLATDPANCGACGQACAAGQACVSGQCTTECPAGQTMCSGACVTLASDPQNCGACGTACATGDVCSSGMCGCPAGTSLCGGVCLDPMNNPCACGTSAVNCDSLPFTKNQTCSNGTCSYQCTTDWYSCSSGTPEQSGSGGNGCPCFSTTGQGVCNGTMCVQT